MNGGVYSTDGNNAANYTNGLPSAINPLILDGSQAGSNQPIVFSSALDIGSLTVQNNYNSTLTISSGATLSTEANDTVNNGCTLTLVSSDAHGIKLNSANTIFTVTSGGTLKLTDPTGATTGGAFLDVSAVNSGEYLKNAGTVSWTGTAVASGQQAIIDAMGTPVLNTGTFNADGGTRGDNTAVGGELLISGWDANTNSVGFDMTAGAVNLTNGATLDTSQNYYQSGGSLTSDASVVTLETGSTNPGDINIAGGKVVVDNVANSVSKFSFDASTVEINGEIDVDGLTTGGQSNQCDRLACGSAAVTLGANSLLEVGTTGTGALGTGNQWVVMLYGSYTGSWGNVTVPPGMTASIGGSQVLIVN